MKEFHSKNSSTETRKEFNNTASGILFRDVNFKVWNVDARDIEYQYGSGHTLSLYLQGGEHTYRCDQPGLKGQSGKLCLMPQDHLSRWHSGSPIHIAHLYLPDAFIRQEAERHLNIDARFANLRDVTYQDDQHLKTAMQKLIYSLKNASQIDVLFAEEALFAISSRLLEHYRQDGAAAMSNSKGLSTQQRRLIKAHIHHNLEQKLSLESLASLLHLSPYHFARLFRQSFGDSPASYIVRQRIDRGKMLLNGKTPCSLIAAECGFSHQSHFINYFKKLTGTTPTNYKKLLQS